MPEAHVLDLMERAARAAGEVLLAHYKKGVAQRMKADHTVVTLADTRSDKLIRRILAPLGYGVLSEESSPDAALTGRVWAIDPLDGTNNFSRGIPIWCVSIGLLEDGRPIAGVIYDPIHDAMYAAREGGPASCNGVRLVPKERPSRFLLQDLAPGLHAKRFFDIIRRFLDEGDMMEAQWRSAALALAATAAGKADAYVGYGQHLWDVAAGVAICRAAGLTVSDWNGKDWQAGGKAFLIARPALHRTILPLVQ